MIAEVADYGPAPRSMRGAGSSRRGF